MLRFAFICAAALCLAGCESDEDFWQPYNDAVSGVFGDAAPTTAAATAPEDSEADHCRKVAYARAADAKANGFDDEMREQVYTGTYQNCITWARDHLDIQS